MKSVAFKIRGMDCAEEVAVLQRELGPLVGGEGHLAFDILNGKMTVFLPEETGIEDTVRQAVAQTGMEAIPWQESAMHRAAEPLWQRRGRTILWVAYPRLAGNYTGPLLSRLRGLHQPVVRSRNVFSAPRSCLLACLSTHLSRAV